MGGLAERLIYLNAFRSFELLSKSIQAFEEFLKERDSTKLEAVYYRARGYFGRGKAFYEETLKNARKFAGPVEEYAPETLVEWRKDLLEKDRILARGSALKDLQAELMEDEVLAKWMSKDEIESFLKQHFEEQKSKERRLPNIKLRMVLAKLKELLLEAQQLERKTQRYYEGMPSE